MQKNHEGVEVKGHESSSLCDVSNRVRSDDDKLKIDAYLVLALTPGFPCFVIPIAAGEEAMNPAHDVKIPSEHRAF